MCVSFPLSPVRCCCCAMRSLALSYFLIQLWFALHQKFACAHCICLYSEHVSGLARCHPLSHNCHTYTQMCVVVYAIELIMKLKFNELFTIS